MKTSHEMTQNVLKKRNKILRRRHILTTSFVALAGTAAVAGALLLTMNIAMPHGVDLVESGLAGNSMPLVIAVNDDPLDLLGCTKNEKGELHIAIELWQVSDNYDLFREYFFGTWESSDNTIEEKIVIDDSEKAFLVNNINFRFQDFYIISEEVLAFVIHGNAESELFWLDISSPDTMYYEPFNGDWLYAVGKDNHKTAVYSKTTAPVNTPENDFLSIYKLREISRDYGIDLDMLLNIEYNDKNSGEVLLHDDWYYFYPVYLFSEEQDKLVLNTTLGNAAGEIGKAQVTYTIEKVGGEWTRNEEIEITAPDDGLGINQDIISELGMTYRELAEKYGSEPRKIKYPNSCIIENGCGIYIWKTSSSLTYDDMEAAGGCNMIDGVKMSELFSGISWPVSYEELVDKYGFTLIESYTELGMFDLYESEFEHPSCGDIRFFFYAREYGVIEKDMSCCIKLKNAGIPNENLLSS